MDVDVDVVGATPEQTHGEEVVNMNVYQAGILHLCKKWSTP